MEPGRIFLVALGEILSNLLVFDLACILDRQAFIRIGRSLFEVKIDYVYSSGKLILILVRFSLLALYSTILF